MDSSTHLLINQANLAIQTSKKEKNIILFIADENTANDIELLSSLENPLKNQQKTNDFHIISNRFNIIEKIKETSPSCITHFNDFDFSQLNIHFDFIIYRISKEKSLTHYIFNQLSHYNSSSTEILIAGKKNEGIKSYASALKKHLASSTNVKLSSRKYKEDYLIKIDFNEKTTLNYDNYHFDDNNYPQAQYIKKAKFCDKEYEIWSKPGTYGWKKLDQGSLLLCDDFIKNETENCHKNSINNKNNLNSCLDLGCGSGLLSLAGNAIGINRIVATDNNAAALKATEMTFKKNNITANVIADNCGSSIEENFDIVLCNPPFHQGFDTNNSLTKQFIKTAQQRLKSSGRAYFVCNSFIGIEKIAEQHFNKIETLTNNKQFKTFVFTK